MPYFRRIKRFLLHETAVHFLDTFRYLAGEIKMVFCQTRRLNPAIVAAMVCPNLYLELSSLLPHHLAEVLQHVPSSWLMIGSDLPENLTAEM